MCNKFIIVFLVLISTVYAEKKHTHPKVCLNMIVKNEKDVIARCLNSVKPLIDYWVIIDTGSTDGTQDEIRKVMKGIPGELHERPWVNFSHNRNEVLKKAKGKGEYHLLIDADEELFYEQPYRFPDLDKDVYFCIVKQKEISFQRAFLIKASLPWKYVGVLHEELVCPQAKKLATLENIYNSATPRDGNRSKNPNKYQNDIAALKKGLETEPENSRYVFYIAQCYRNLKDYKNAYEWYKRRSKMIGNAFEHYWSVCSMAMLQEMFGMSSDLVVQSYCRAYQLMPRRAEPLYCLSLHYYKQGKYFLGYAVAKSGLHIPKDRNQIGFYNPDINAYGIKYVLANCAFKIGRIQEAYDLYSEILSNYKLKPEFQQEIEGNRDVAYSNLKDKKLHIR